MPPRGEKTENEIVNNSGVAARRIKYPSRGGPFFQPIPLTFY